MKKCPYCSEMIQDDAKKCKHCGEWIETKTQSFFNKAKTFISEKQEQIKSKQNAHLFIPTEQVPLIIENATFYPDRCIIGNTSIPYRNINHIEFKSESTEINFSVSRSITFAIHHSINLKEQSERTLIIDEFDDGAIIKRIDKKIAEQLNLISNVISKLTYTKRLFIYYQEIQEKGFFTYKNIYKFYQNGDVAVNDVIKANIKTKWEREELNWMTYSRGFRSSSYNPYEFSFPNDKTEGFKLFNKSTNIETTYDKDIFDPMLITFLQKGFYIPKPD